MTKRERIEALERQVAELRQEVNQLRADLVARPYWPYWPYYTWPIPGTPLEPYKITWTRDTTGTDPNEAVTVSNGDTVWATYAALHASAKGI